MKNIRVLMIVTTDGFMELPNLQIAQDVFVNNPYSLQIWCVDNLSDAMNVSIDVVGPFAAPVPITVDWGSRTTRAQRVQLAKDAASNAGVKVDEYDVWIQMMHGINPKAWDIGNAGFGYSTLTNTTDGPTVAHEVAHALGFQEHTYGMLTTAADFGSTGALSPAYGDPYDIMSGSNRIRPSTPLPQRPAPKVYPGMGQAPQMMARAELHFKHPEELTVSGKTIERSGSDGSASVTLWPVGSGAPGRPELLVFHPTTEQPDGRGRVYVELRAKGEKAALTKWDEGLGSSVDNLPGLIVHTLGVTMDDTPVQVLWYCGRILFPGPDADVSVENFGFSGTHVTVSVGESQRSFPVEGSRCTSRRHRFACLRRSCPPPQKTPRCSAPSFARRQDPRSSTNGRRHRPSRKLRSRPPCAASASTCQSRVKERRCSAAGRWTATDWT